MRRPLGSHTLNQLRIADGRHMVTWSAYLCAPARLCVLSRCALKRTIANCHHTDSMLKRSAVCVGVMLPRPDRSACRFKANPASTSLLTSVVTATASTPRPIQRIRGLVSKRVRISFLYLKVRCWQCRPSTDIGGLARDSFPVASAWTDRFVNRQTSDIEHCSCENG